MVGRRRRRSRWGGAGPFQLVQEVDGLLADGRGRFVVPVGFQPPRAHEEVADAGTGHFDAEHLLPIPKESGQHVPSPFAPDAGLPGPARAVP